MQTNRFVTLGVLLAATFASAADGRPTLSQSPITSEQIEVYRAFLTSYAGGGKSPHFNLAKHTYPLDLSNEKRNDECLKGIDLDDAAPPESVMHEFDPRTPLRENITLVLSEHPKAAIQEHLKSGHTFRRNVQDIDSSGRVRSLSQHGECLEGRKETANHSVRSTGMVSAKDPGDHASASRDHQRLSARRGCGNMAAGKMETRR